jgi:hypothetical protein
MRAVIAGRKPTSYFRAVEPILPRSETGLELWSAGAAAPLDDLDGDCIPDIALGGFYADFDPMDPAFEPEGGIWIVSGADIVGW